MKSKLLQLSALIIVILFGIISCGKKDETKPLIFLNGSKKEYVAVQDSTYTDQGAYADDNYDGDISKKITISHDISGLDNSIEDWQNLIGKPDRIGEYTVTYKVTDSEGNANEKDRTVIVYNEAQKYAIDYNVDYSVVTNGTGDLTPIESLEQTVDIDSKENRRIIIRKLANISSCKIHIDIIGDIYDINPDSTIEFFIEQQYADVYTDTDGDNNGYNDTIRYSVLGNTNECKLLDNIFYKFQIVYSIDKYRVVNGGSSLVWLKGDVIKEVYTSLVGSSDSTSTQ